MERRRLDARRERRLGKEHDGRKCGNRGRITRDGGHNGREDELFQKMGASEAIKVEPRSLN